MSKDTYKYHFRARDRPEIDLARFLHGIDTRPTNGYIIGTGENETGLWRNRQPRLTQNQFSVME